MPLICSVFLSSALLCGLLKISYLHQKLETLGKALFYLLIMKIQIDLFDVDTGEVYVKTRLAVCPHPEKVERQVLGYLRKILEGVTNASLLITPYNNNQVVEQMEIF